MKWFFGWLLWIVVATHAFAQAPTVVVSILPLYHIAQAVMGNVGHPVLLVPEGASEHAYALKPSQYAAIQKADVLIWIGPSLETYLTDAIAKVPVSRQMVLLAEPYMLRYPLRQTDDTIPQNVPMDPHLWLDSFNAMTIAKQLEKRLSALDPERQKIYRRNVAKFVEKISALNTELEKKLTPMQSIPFLVYHDAFQYFEKRYGLKRLDSIVLSPTVPIGAKRWLAMSQLVKAEHIPCIFSEPQNHSDTLKQFATENHVKLGVLNPMGAEIPAGTEGYAALLTDIADELVGCLGQSESKQQLNH